MQFAFFRIVQTVPRELKGNCISVSVAAVGLETRECVVIKVILKLFRKHEASRKVSWPNTAGKTVALGSTSL
jgi:hypothetical protein